MRAEILQDKLSIFEMGAEHVERLQHVVWYRTEDETKELDTERMKESEYLQLPCLLDWPSYFSVWLGKVNASQTRQGSKS